MRSVAIFPALMELRGMPVWREVVTPSIWRW